MNADRAIMILLGHIVGSETEAVEARTLGALALVKVRQLRQAFVHARSVSSAELDSYLALCRDACDTDRLLAMDVPPAYIRPPTMPTTVHGVIGSRGD